MKTDCRSKLRIAAGKVYTSAFSLTHGCEINCLEAPHGCEQRSCLARWFGGRSGVVGLELFHRDETHAALCASDEPGPVLEDATLSLLRRDVDCTAVCSVDSAVAPLRMAAAHAWSRTD